MYLYQEVGGPIILGEGTLPHGRFILKSYKNGTVVSLFSVDNHKQIMGATEVTSLQKKDNSFYTDLDELLVEIKKLFVKHGGVDPVPLFGIFDHSFDNSFN